MSTSIRAIDSGSVHRIHSGQVVLDLQGAIKELVENSLDAGATIIDVRIKDNGLDTIEVSDNGSGIAQVDWEGIALKHHTSKLPSLAELHKVTTFGFRGEALSALCALCESVTVVTATKETAPMGGVIKMGRDGRVLDSTGRVARPRGTTITLAGLFVPLPVRRKEFDRTVKRELTKALSLLTAYALVPASVSQVDGRQGVRLKVETIAAGKGGKRNTQLSTDGRGSLRSSVSSVWGPKALETVQDINLKLQVEVDRVMARREGLKETSQDVKVVGLISSAQWGQGRASADRQFYYINGRPCNLTSISRAINEVYKGFNTHQVPLAILDFQIPPESVDINVSPDKRTIFVHSEERLLEALRIALEEYFQPSRSTFAVGGATQTVKTIRHIQSQLSMGGQTKDSDDNAQDNTAENDEEDVGASGTTDGDDRSGISGVNGGNSSADVEQGANVMEIDIESEGEEELSQNQSQIQSRSSNRTRTAPPKSPAPPASRRVIQQTINTSKASWSPDRKSARAGPGPSSRDARANLRKRLEGYASQSGKVLRVDSDGEEEDGSEEAVEDKDADHVVPEVEEMFPSNTDGDQEDEAMAENPDDDAGQPLAESLKRGRPPDEPVFIDDPGEGSEVGIGEDRDNSEDSNSPVVADDPIGGDPHSVGNGEDEAEGHSHAPLLRHGSSSYRDEISSTAAQGEITLKFNMPRLKARYTSLRPTAKLENGKVDRNAYTAMKEGGLASAAGISNKDSAQAEEALARVISKDDFEKMEVLGQFNKGFIIARLKSDSADDLFIVDQHASDEKYNFETLQRTTVIKGQALIKPRPLQLTAGDEIVAMENLDVLHSNGFDVKVDEERPPGRGERISLLAMPVSKDTTFDFKDLEQLLHLLSDGARPTGQMVRCTKARSMFAMRACRRSVMIGKSLTINQMVQLLRNMGTIDQPWNCPHGRPTMRHLTKLDPPKKSNSELGRIDWDKWKTDREAI